jgi:hypothetical protein
MTVATGELVDQIKAAIGAHGMWKQRLAQAIRTRSNEHDPATVQRDDRCDFGKWLQGALPRLSGEQAKDGQHIRDLHAKFHTEAANVLRLASSGQDAAATKALEGPYTAVSADLTKAMMDWQMHTGQHK